MEAELGITINVNSIFAAQIKRLHEVGLENRCCRSTDSWHSTKGRPSIYLGSFIVTLKSRRLLLLSGRKCRLGPIFSPAKLHRVSQKSSLEAE